MLVLTRRSGEALHIGTEIRVTVLSVSGGQVRIGIEAPSQVPIHREEVFERIVEANRGATGVPDEALAALVSHRRDSEEDPS